jgi:CRISPR/Cas system CSM-associated protein Csm4 (group 5 of RAMP superfamily)
MLTLSLFRPLPDELTAIDGFPAEDNRFKYRIELREGRVGHLRVDLKKQAHRYFTEGSVFPLLPGLKTRHLGSLVHQFDKPHPVWDNGFGFMVHLKWQ